MATTMEEIRQLQQQLFEAQQGKSVARLTDSNVVELVQLLLQRELVTLHLSGQGYITPKQLANEIKDQLLLSGGRISLAELHAAINTDIGIIEDRVEKMCEENPPSADPRTPGVVLEEGQLIADYYMDDIAAEVNTELQEMGQITLSTIAARYNFSSDFLVEAMRRRMGSMIDGQMQPGAVGVVYTSAFVDRHCARLRGAFSAVTVPGSVTKMRKSMGFQVRACSAVRADLKCMRSDLILDRVAFWARTQDSLFSKQVTGLIKQKRLSATYQPSSHIYTPRVHAAIQDSQVQTFYDGNGFVEFQMLEGLGIRGAAKVHCPSPIAHRMYLVRSESNLPDCCLRSFVAMRCLTRLRSIGSLFLSLCLSVCLSAA